MEKNPKNPNPKSPKNDSPSRETYCIKDNTLRAEILWTLKVVSSHLS